MDPQRRRVRVLVLGGRLTPSLVGVLSDPPDSIEFIVSSDTPTRESEARAVLAEPMRGRLPLSPLPLVRAFDWKSCADTCCEAVARHPGAELVFDVTTAPKVMGFAAYEFAKANEHDVLIVDTANRRFISLRTRQSWPVQFPQTVQAYLKLFGRTYQPGGGFRIDGMSMSEKDASEAARLLALQGRVAQGLLNKVRPLLSGGRGSPALTDGEYEILIALGNAGLIKDVARQSDGGVLCRATDNPHDRGFLTGHWLELFVRDEARSVRENTGRVIFDDCQSSFEMPEPGRVPRELDVGCLYRGQLIVCSCKTGDTFQARQLDELNGVAELVGGRFVSRVYVTNVSAPTEDDDRERQKQYRRFCDHAQQQQVVVVAGDELRLIGEKLAQEAFDPTYPRI